MDSVTVNTQKTGWGVTHHVTGHRGDCKRWCKNVESTSGYNRVLYRKVSKNEDGSETWRVDVDTVHHQPHRQQNNGPGYFTVAVVGFITGLWLG